MSYVVKYNQTTEMLKWTVMHLVAVYNTCGQTSYLCATKRALFCAANLVNIEFMHSNYVGEPS